VPERLREDRDSIVLRRSDGGSAILLAILALGSLVLLLVPASSWACRLAPLGILLPLAALVHLGGPAATVTVEPSEVTVRNIFTTYRVPRACIADITEHLGPALVLCTGKRIRLLAFESPLAAGRGHYARRLRGLRFALQRVPESPAHTSQPVHRSTRRGHVSLAIGAALLFAGSAYFLLAYCAQHSARSL
jgi:hypothetical protein